MNRSCALSRQAWRSAVFELRVRVFISIDPLSVLAFPELGPIAGAILGNEHEFLKAGITQESASSVATST